MIKSIHTSDTFSDDAVIGVLGGSGFIGSYFIKYLNSRSQNFTCLKVGTRNKRNFLKPDFRLPLEVVECDHLNYKQVTEFFRGCTHIIDFAGLAWQHPGGKITSKNDLLKQEIVQNAVSALIKARNLQADQLLVWTSTSAIETMFARLSEKDSNTLRTEVEKLAAVLLEIPDKMLHDSSSLNIFLDKILSEYNFSSFRVSPTARTTIIYATEFSYAYSKLLGQILLEKLCPERVRILQISDVYGPGQDISEKILDPLVAARRIQRYISAYKAIAEGHLEWLPVGTDLFGFTRDSQNLISQKIWSDWVFPTHVEDVCNLVLRSCSKGVDKPVLRVHGNRVSNLELMQFLKNYFNSSVRIIENEPLDFEMVQNSQDLEVLGVSKLDLIDFKTGIKNWIEDHIAVT